MPSGRYLRDEAVAILFARRREGSMPPMTADARFDLSIFSGRREHFYRFQPRIPHRRGAFIGMGYFRVTMADGLTRVRVEVRRQRPRGVGTTVARAALPPDGARCGVDCRAIYSIAAFIGAATPRAPAFRVRGGGRHGHRADRRQMRALRAGPSRALEALIHRGGEATLSPRARLPRLLAPACR